MPTRIEVYGLKELRRKLQGNELYAAPYRKALETIAKDAEETGRRLGPKGATGQLTKLMESAVQSKPIPNWARVKTTATRPPSARALERAAARDAKRAARKARTGVVQQRPTAIKGRVRAKAKSAVKRRRRVSSRKPFPYPRLLEYAEKWGHKGWLRDAVKQSLGRTRTAALATAAREIERNWGRK